MLFCETDDLQIARHLSLQSHGTAEGPIAKISPDPLMSGTLPLVSRDLDPDDFDDKSLHYTH